MQKIIWEIHDGEGDVEVHTETDALKSGMSRAGTSKSTKRHLCLIMLSDRGIIQLPLN